MQTSPVQRLMSRRTKTLVPIGISFLKSEVADGVTEKIELKRQKAKSYNDKQAKRLPELEIGQEVQIAPNLRGKPWNLGMSTEKLSDRSYIVESNGEQYRRNREHLIWRGILDKIVIRSCAVRHYIVLHNYVAGDTISYPICCLIVMAMPLCRTTCCYIVPDNAIS